MKSAIYMEGNCFKETEFNQEENFEKIIKENAKTFFGPSSIWIDAKSKIQSKALGNSIPDGFLFDFRDPDNPEFYLVEIELAKHDFYEHIFPQITKFFAFYKKPESRDKLQEKLHAIIEENPKYKEEFVKFSGKKEIYKTIKDSLENSQNILLILDENKLELAEIFETYSDTWAKFVKVEIVNYLPLKRQAFTWVCG